MTQHRVEIKPEDREGWQQWMNCAAKMGDELRLLNVPSVNEILNRYEFRRCDYGMGLNIDWPDREHPLG